MKNSRIAIILATSTMALTPCSSFASNSVDPASDEVPLFTSAPALGSRDEILSRTPEEAERIVADLDTEQQRALSSEISSIEEYASADVVERDTSSIVYTPPIDYLKTANFYQKMDLDSFIKGPKRLEPEPYNWNDDGCSLPPGISTLGAGYSRLFNKGCVRHDFGYRNYGPKSKMKLGRSNYNMYRNVADRQLLNDCLSLSRNNADKATAWAFYTGVQLGGGFAF